jgi:hypothetical protein
MLCTHKVVGSTPVFSRSLWDEAAVACQFHALNVEGSNPSPTVGGLYFCKLIWWNGRHGGLKIHSFCEGLGSTPRMGSRYGGIGRHDGFRIHWLYAVQVQLLLPV